MNRYPTMKKNFIFILLCMFTIFIFFPTKAFAHSASLSSPSTHQVPVETAPESTHSFDAMLYSWISKKLWLLLNQYKLLFLYFMIQLLTNVTPILAIGLFAPYLL